MRTAVSTVLAALTMTVTVHAADFHRAPDVLPGTTAAVREPGFWIARMSAPDDVVMTPAGIQAMNDAYQARIRRPAPFANAAPERRPNTDHWWPGYEIVIPDAFAMDGRALADTVRAKLGLEAAYLTRQTYGNPHGIPYAGWEIDEFVAMLAADRVPASITPRRGITVRTARLRNVPNLSPLQVGTWEEAVIRFDMFTVSMLGMANPVAILHTSANGDHVFVLCREGYGWMRAEDVAFATPEETAAVCAPVDFVTCTGDRVCYYTGPDCTVASGWFGMGDRLPLVGDNDPRHVSIPVRTTSGRLVMETAWLAAGAEVCVGLLPFTRRNIVTTAFRLLDNTFDWSNGWYGRNAESTYRDIFRCFGFELPFHGLLFTHFGTNTKVCVPPATNDKNVREVNAGYTGQGMIEAPEQFAIINSNPPFLTINCLDNGHCQLYLGQIDGAPYVFDTHGYGYVGEDGTPYEIKRTVVANMAANVPAYALGKPMRFLELTK